MKKNTFALLAIATVSFCGCQKEMPTPTPAEEPLNIINVMEKGKELDNPNYGGVGVSFNLDGSMETLKSFRHVSRGRVYYMDYKVQFPWNEFIIKDKNNRFTVNNYLKFNKKVNDTFGLPSLNDFIDAPRGCSGFICKNEKNELLFGRNLDGVPGQMVILFNRNVPEGEYKSVMLSNVCYANRWNGAGEYDDDASLLKDGIDLSVLLRQNMAVMDGMNEHGLCFAAYQLPNYQHYEDGELAEIEFPDDSPRPWSIDQNTGKPQITLSVLHNRILSTCRTVEDVRKLFLSYDYTCLIPNTAVHWFIADAEGHCAVFEYWNRGIDPTTGEKTPDTLYIMDTEKDRILATHGALAQVPYERNSIENYYCNPEANVTFNTDHWQLGFSNKCRVQRMMTYYWPVMSEEQALRCLQQGNFGMELPSPQVTDWSCVYNPKQGTLLFNMRDDLSEVYFLNVYEELRK